MFTLTAIGIILLPGITITAARVKKCQKSTLLNVSYFFSPQSIKTFQAFLKQFCPLKTDLN